MDSLPKEARLPEGVAWCDRDDGYVRIEGEAWENLDMGVRACYAARCCAWWENEHLQLQSAVALTKVTTVREYMRLLRASIVQAEIWREIWRACEKGSNGAA